MKERHYLIEKQAQPPHAGIYLYMNLYPSVGLSKKGIIKQMCSLYIKYYRRQIVFYNIPYLVRIYAPQNDEPRLNPCPPELIPLFAYGDAKKITSGLLQSPRYLHRTIAICIFLYHCKYLYAFGQVFF